MQSQSRRQRRKMAKDLGLLGKKETFTQMLERSRRAREYGEMLHRQNLTRLKNEGNNTENN